VVNFSDFELMPFPDQLQAELDIQSDRGLAVLGSAGLEFLLEGLLRARMLDEKSSDRAFEGNGPLSTFSSRISVSFLFGLISKDEHAELQIVRKVRNLLTHEIRHASFSSTQQIRDLCANLRLGERLYTPSLIPFAVLPSGDRGIPAQPDDYPLLPPQTLVLPDRDQPRSQFAASVQVLTRTLVARTLMAERPTPPDEFTSPEEPVSAGLDRVESRMKDLAAPVQRLVEMREKLVLEGKDVPPELLDIPGTSKDDLASARQIELFLLMGRYANKVIRRSKAATDHS
jgi:hypothetical protein